MKKIGICGRFGFGLDLNNGQTIKTKIIAEELKKEFGEDQVLTVDSYGGMKAVPRMLWQSLQLFRKTENVLFLPAHKGLRVFAPVYAMYNLFYRRRIHYIVIGGWLDGFLNVHRWLIPFLKRFTGIYVETSAMKSLLEKRNLNNVTVMPNFKDLQILSPDQLHYTENPPYNLCTFSRVTKTKGIEEAIEAVKLANQELGKEFYTLDIYGQIDPDYEERWETLQKEFPDFIRYKGTVPFEQSVQILRPYFALLFPTYYPGEGFAGTLLDAMAAGVPVIASDWRYNNEVVVPGQTGVLIPACDADKLKDKLIEISHSVDNWNKLKITSLSRASLYRPETAIQPLRERLQDLSKIEL